MPVDHIASEKIEIPSAGAVFSDGSMLDLMRDPSNPSRLQLLYAQKGACRISDRVTHAGATYVPWNSCREVPAQLRLPTHVGAEESPRKLFGAIRIRHANHLGQCESSTILLASIPFISWTSDFLPMTPIVWVRTAPTSPKSATIRLLSALCRRPIVLAGIRRGDLQNLPWHLNATFLLDEPDLLSSMQRLLAGSSRRGVCIVGGRRLSSFYGPKIVFRASSPTKRFFREPV
jgi:hypothetical protein